MGWFSEDSDNANAYDQVVNAPHKAELRTELVAAAAAYEAAKAYDKHTADFGQPETHAKAKEMLAAFAGAFVDRIVEEKGLDSFDKEKAKQEANEQLYDVSAGDF